MAIRITKDTTSDPLVESDVVITTIEKNRDRLRTTASMIVGLSSMSLSASLAIAIFLVREHVAQKPTVVLISMAAFQFLLAAILAVESSFFRRNYRISTCSRFVADLLHVFEREIRFVRFASLAALGGLVFLFIATVLQALSPM